MKPATARDCLSHCRDRMKVDDYETAVEQIQLLIAVERFDAAQRVAIASALQYAPISPDEAAR